MTVVVAVKTEAFFGGEYDVFDGFYFGGRTGEANLLRVCVNVGSAPFVEIQVRAVVDKFLLFFGQAVFLAWCDGLFEFHDALSVAWAAFGC